MGGRGQSFESNSLSLIGTRFVADDDGSSIDLGGMRLRYGKKDPAITGVARKNVETIEGSWRDAQVENNQTFNADGTLAYKGRTGEQTRVRVSQTEADSPIYTHNHPREAGVLGGTFSVGDIDVWTNSKNITHRAVAKEGVYSITKGKNFDADGARLYCHSVVRKATERMEKKSIEAYGRYAGGLISYDDYVRIAHEITNVYLIEIHDGYSRGARKYGYTYTLERRN